MTYKGYTAKIEFDEKALLFHGEVIGLKDVVTFQATEATELRQAFRDSVDDYLDFCRERGEEPEKPLSGKFVVRLPQQLHRQLVTEAKIEGISLNQLVVHLLSEHEQHA